MNTHQLVPIERTEGVTLYGRIIGPNGKLGQFEVHSDYLGNNGHTYVTYTEAKNRMNALIGILKK